MLRDIIDAKVIAAHRLRIRFEDGVEGEVDVAGEISFTGVFAALQDPDYFARVRVVPELGTVVWPNGADLDPVVLYARITGRQLPQPRGRSHEPAGRPDSSR
jgi:uncharacterized protein DUF2442